MTKNAIRPCIACYCMLTAPEMRNATAEMHLLVLVRTYRTCVHHAVLLRRGVLMSHTNAKTTLGLPLSSSWMRRCSQDFEADIAQGLPLVPPADHVVVPRAVYDRLRHAWNDRVLEASVGL